MATRSEEYDDMVPVLVASILDAYTIPDAPITAHDRCDACGAGAAVRMHWPPSEEHPHRRGDLQFCRHHHRKHMPKLMGDGWAVAVEAPQ